MPDAVYTASLLSPAPPPRAMRTQVRRSAVLNSNAVRHYVASLWRRLGVTAISWTVQERRKNITHYVVIISPPLRLTSINVVSFVAGATRRTGVSTWNPRGHEISSMLNRANLPFRCQLIFHAPFCTNRSQEIPLEREERQLKFH